MNRVSFRERHSKAVRFCHWAILIPLSFLLLTAFCGKTFLNQFTLAKILGKQFAKQPIHWSDRQIWDTATLLRENLWTTHTVFGYILTGLLLFRLIAEFFQNRDEKMAFRIKSSFGLLIRKQQVKESRHYFVVKIFHCLGYILLGLLAITGAWMGLNRNTSVYFTDKFHSVKEVHEFAVNLLLIFVFIHITGVILAERGKYKNIVSDMINGGKRMEN